MNITKRLQMLYVKRWVRKARCLRSYVKAMYAAELDSY